MTNSMKKSVKMPRKEFMQVVYIDMEKSFAHPELVTDTITAIFDSLKKRAMNSLIQEGLKKSGDGVCIRAWIVPAYKVPVQHDK